MSESELGYIALHIHSAIAEQNVASSMQVARCVRECINLIEQEINQTIPVTTLSYNRLMNHVRYMILRAEQKEEIKLSMNDYMELRFKKSYGIATYDVMKWEKSCICNYMRMSWDIWLCIFSDALKKLKLRLKNKYS